MKKLGSTYIGKRTMSSAISLIIDWSSIPTSSTQRMHGSRSCSIRRRVTTSKAWSGVKRPTRIPESCDRVSIYRNLCFSLKTVEGESKNRNNKIKRLKNRDKTVLKPLFNQDLQCSCTVITLELIYFETVDTNTRDCNLIYKKLRKRVIIITAQIMKSIDN